MTGSKSRDFRQHDGQHLFGQRDRTRVVVDDRERLTPVALPAEQPVAQLVRDRGLPDLGALQPFGDDALGLGDAQPVERYLLVRRVLCDTVGNIRLRPRSRVVRVGVVLGQPVVVRTDDGDDRQFELAGELEVALVVRGHGHDRTGAVTHQHVVGDEDRDARVVGGVDRERAGEHTGFLPGFGLTLEVGLARRELAVARNGIGRRIGCAEKTLPRVERVAREVVRKLIVGPLVRRDDVDQRVLGRQHHVGGAEQRVGARGEHLDADILVGLDREAHRRAGRAADPVPLHQLDGVGPVERVEIVEQPVGVRGDAQHPLLQRPAIHREVAALAAAVAGDLFVGENRAESGAPVHRRVGLVGHAVRVDELPLRRRVEIVERNIAGRVEAAGAELLHQRGDRTGPARVFVVPRVVDLQKDPLRPAVVVDVGGGGPAARIMAEAERAQLPLHRGDVLFSRGARVRPRLHRVLLGG